MKTTAPIASATASASSTANANAITTPNSISTATPTSRCAPPLLALAWATFFGVGYAPLAPGTAGTLAAVPLWWLLSHLPWPAYAIVTLGIIVTGMAAAERAGRYYGVADSGHIVIDEVAGYLVTMAFLPPHWICAAGGFVLFRLFDVVKPPPARFFDRDPRWKNGAGVVLDDLFAGVWAWAGTFLLARFFGVRG